MLLYRIETVLYFECGSILFTYNLSYSLKKYNKTSVKFRKTIKKNEHPKMPAWF